MLQWIDVAVFNELQSKAEFSGPPIQECVNIELTFHEIDPLIDGEPFGADVDGIGKTVNWFGVVDQHPFYLMNLTESPTPKTLMGASTFEILPSLKGLTPTFFKHITWINHYPDPALFSVFSEDRNGIRVEVYRSGSLEEADTTAFFLNEYSQSKQFYVDSSEDLDRTWLVMESRPDGEVEIGRYVDRLSAEYFALDYRSQSDHPIQVREAR